MPDSASAAPAASGGRYAAANLLALPRLVRLHGVAVDAEQSRLLLRALAEIDLDRADDMRAAARAVLVRHPADVPRFEDAFDTFVALLRGARPSSVNAASRHATRMRESELPALAPEQGGGALRASRNVRVVASPLELLRRVDFAAMTAEERAAAARFLGTLEWAPGLRRSRRFERSTHGALDARATLARSRRWMGEPLELVKRTPRHKRRPLVLLLDISGSMDVYTRLLLQLAHALARGWGRVEAFTFGTRLTRVTRHMRHRRADHALAGAAHAVADWSGGTRIGEGLHEFNRRWSRRVLGRGAVVLLCTDGWERGDVAQLAAEARALQRASYRLVWLNPLAGTRGYAPEAAGAKALAAAVDDHLPASTLDGLAAIAALLAKAGRGRPVRRQPPTRAAGQAHARQGGQ
ncbi:MAG TPA: VWA domain-containing protein [Candidatus Limnocylindria bacterium]|nr:VWA domain-containing protein [Candidatus Limnocylindria bacterium]